MSVDPIGCLREACDEAGSQKAWADANWVSAAYVGDVLCGRREPGAAILKPLGLKRIVTYERACSVCGSWPGNLNEHGGWCEGVLTDGADAEGTCLKYAKSAKADSARITGGGHG